MSLKTYNPILLREAGCELADPPELFHALVKETKGDPCLTGCFKYNGGECPAYKKYAVVSDYVPPPPPPNSEKLGGKWKGKSLKQIAQAQGISKNEAQRRRDRGEYA